MKSINQVTLMGNLGADPELRKANDVSVVSFSLATSETYKDKNGEKKEVTEWHNIVAWRDIADLMSKYLNKGDTVHVSGKLKTRSWEKDNVKRYTTEIVVDDFILIKKKNELKPQE